MDFRDVIPESAVGYVKEHPKVLAAVCGALVAFNLYNLYGSVRLLVKAREIIADAQRAASEALGG